MSGVWEAPGRVNLIGEHVDYADGLVMPFAIDRVVRVNAGLRTDGMLKVTTDEFAGEVVADVTSLTLGSLTGWASYVAGVVWATQRSGVDVPGLDLHISSNVPVGAGLSSSAALEAATALALDDLLGLGTARMELALRCHLAETEFVGAPVGIMDQAASLLSTQSHALLLDCRSLEVTHVPLELPGHIFLVIDSRVKHTTTGSAYADRRRSVEEAARLLGLPSLREARADSLEVLPAALRSRARHVVTEIGRVRSAAAALEGGDVEQLGVLLSESHASLRDDFEVSCAELDLIVAAAIGAGALGARLTGAGFGGCAIALVPDAAVDAVVRAVGLALPAAGVFPVRPSASAHRVR